MVLYIGRRCNKNVHGMTKKHPKPLLITKQAESTLKMLMKVHKKKMLMRSQNHKFDKELSSSIIPEVRCIYHIVIYFMT